MPPDSAQASQPTARPGISGRKRVGQALAQPPEPFPGAYYDGGISRHRAASGPLPSIAMSFSGTPEQLSAVRKFVRSHIPPQHPAQATAELVASELAANAIQHSASGACGGWLTVCLGCDPERVTVLVIDHGARGEPVLRFAGPDDEDGRGLALVIALAESFTVSGNDSERRVTAVLAS